MQQSRRSLIQLYLPTVRTGFLIFHGSKTNRQKVNLVLKKIIVFIFNERDIGILCLFPIAYFQPSLSPNSPHLAFKNVFTVFP